MYNIDKKLLLRVINYDMGCKFFDNIVDVPEKLKRRYIGIISDKEYYSKSRMYVILSQGKDTDEGRFIRYNMYSLGLNYIGYPSDGGCNTYSIHDRRSKILRKLKSLKNTINNEVYKIYLQNIIDAINNSNTNLVELEYTTNFKKGRNM